MTINTTPPARETASLIALLQNVIRANYEHAATAPPTTAPGYERIADAVATIRLKTITRLRDAELPVEEVADQVAASIFIRLRDIPVESAEYRELDGIRQTMHWVRHHAIHSAAHPAQERTPPS